MKVDTSIPTRTLVLGMARLDGSLAAGEIYRTATAAGMSGQQVRLCLRRLVLEGRYKQEGRGQQATFLPLREDAAEQPDMEFVYFAYEQDAGRAPWDETWHLVGFNVPEAARTARDTLRDRLMYLGAAAIHGGLYASPNAWEELVLEAARTAGVERNLTLLTTPDLSVGGVHEPRVLARTLWPLETLAGDYRAFLTDLDSRLSAPAPPTPEAGLAAVFRTVLEFSTIMERDPLLPPELLPAHWPGTRARAEIGNITGLLAESAEDPDAPAIVRLLREPIDHPSPRLAGQHPETAVSSNAQRSSLPGQPSTTA
ncbi:MAG: PaaX family transcriptional regulator C-terminal domain-containing protein [Solirubrobacteraceae bacterium]